MTAGKILSFAFEKKDWVHLSILCDESDKKIKYLEKALLADCKDGFVWHDLGDLYADFDDRKASYCWKMASKFYSLRLDSFKDDAIKYHKDPNYLLFMDVDSTSVESEISRCYFNLGSIHFNLENYTLAIDAYKKAYSLKPDGHSALYFIAKAYKNISNYTEAEKYLLENIEKTSDYESYYLLGLVYLEKHQFRLAQEYFWECIETCNKDASSYNYKFLCFDLLGNAKAAKKNQDRAIKLEPENLNYLYEMAEYCEINFSENEAKKYYEKIHQIKSAIKEKLIKVECNLD